MKKTIFEIALIAGLASCGGNEEKQEAVGADSTAVAVDTAAITTTSVVADSAKVDSVATK